MEVQPFAKKYNAKTQALKGRNTITKGKALRLKAK